MQRGWDDDSKITYNLGSEGRRVEECQKRERKSVGSRKPRHEDHDPAETVSRSNICSYSKQISGQF